MAEIIPLIGETHIKTPGHLLSQMGGVLADFSVVSFGLEDDKLVDKEMQGFGDPDNLSKKFQLSVKLGGILEARFEGKDVTELMQDAYLGSTAEERAAYGHGLAVLRRRNQRAVENLEASTVRILHPEWNRPDDMRIDTWDRERVDELFPHGDFVFHATTTHAAASIVETGHLMSSHTRAARNIEQMNESMSQTNGGDIGISWNLNTVTIVPSNLDHLSGFLAAPTTVEDHDMQFIIPTICGDDEVQSVSSSIKEVELMKKTDYQHRMWMSAHDHTMLIKNIPREYLHDHPAMGDLRRSFAALADMTDEELYEYKHDITWFSTDVNDKNISPLAILMHSLMEGGDITLTAEEAIQPENSLRLASAASRVFSDELLGDEYETICARADAQKSRISQVILPVEDMIFVCGDADAAYWINLFKSSQHSPKGILIYDQKTARVPNFSIERGLGDQKVLDTAIRKVIPATAETTSWASHFKNGLSAVSDRNPVFNYLVPIPQAIEASQPRFH